MSWSASFTAVAKDEIGSLTSPTFQTETADESADQFTAALQAARVAATAVGLPEDKVHVTVSGHANEGHVNPKEGWAADCISISVTWAAPPIEATASEA